MERPQQVLKESQKLETRRKSDSSLITNIDKIEPVKVRGSSVNSQPQTTAIGLYSWGFSKYGQAGTLNYQYIAEPSLIKKENENSINISQISCGEFHSTYLTNDKKMFVFGKNTFGQLGLGHNEISSIPIEINFFYPKILIEKIACGGEHTLALSSTNDLYSWGLNIFGQLGINSTENKNIPVRVEKLRTIVKNEENSNIMKEFLIKGKSNDTEMISEISAGAQHSLILTSKNYLYSCGFSQNGSLGYFSGKDDPHESLVFTRIQLKQSSKKFTKIACGVNHSGCILESKEILIWGKGDNLQIDGIKKVPFGNFHQTNTGHQRSLSTNEVSSQNPNFFLNNSANPSNSQLIVADLQIGENFFIICTESGDLYSCGTNDYGQLGVGIQYKYIKTPEKIPISEKIKNISVGYAYAFAVGYSNKIYAWGNNKYGQLLDISSDKIPQPKEILLPLLNSENSTPILFASGAYHAVIYNKISSSNSNFINSIQKSQDPINSKFLSLNKNFDPEKLSNEVKMLEYLEKKQKSVEEESQEKLKEIEKLKKSIEEKKEIKKKLDFPHRHDSFDNELRTNNLELFDEEIKFEDLVFYNNPDVGTGTFGEVKKGYWRKTIVAVKFLKKAMENEEGSIKSFVEELNLLKKLRHPNILLYIGACTAGPHYFLVTEFCENGNLFDFLHTHTKKTNLTNKDRLRIALEIAKGVNYLHSFNPPVLHRDLKSLNILLDKNLQVKIADFGWARLRDNHMTKQRGTFQWMAPEVIKKNTYSEKADVFSFAIILWELWMQQPPYKNIDKIQVARKVATDKNYRPKLTNEIPEDIIHLMVACWDYDPDNRPNFEAVIDYLENLEREGKL